MAKNFDNDQPKKLNTIISGTTVTGSINCTGDIRIDGTLEGTLNAQGRVVIGTTGLVKGEITCKNSQIEGNVEGIVTVTELLSLKSTSSILGDIKTGKISIEPGATFTGNCKMSGADAKSTIKTDDTKRK